MSAPKLTAPEVLALARIAGVIPFAEGYSVASLDALETGRFVTLKLGKRIATPKGRRFLCSPAGRVALAAHESEGAK